jgi:hypothetical protein
LLLLSLACAAAVHLISNGARSAAGSTVCTVLFALALLNAFMLAVSLFCTVYLADRLGDAPQLSRADALRPLSPSRSASQDLHESDRPV